MAKFSCLLLLVVFSAADAQDEDDCAGFPFADDPAWAELELRADSFEEKAEGSFEATVGVRDGEGKSSGLKDVFRERVPLFSSCWWSAVAGSGRDPSQQMVARLENATAVVNSKTLSRSQVNYNGGFKFSQGVSPCFNYSAAVLFEEGNSSAALIQGSVHFLPSPPPPAKYVTVTVAVDNPVSATVDFVPGYEGCSELVDRVLLECPDRQWSFSGKPAGGVNLTNLRPGMLYSCSLTYSYLEGNGASPGAAFMFRTFDVERTVTPGSRFVLLDLGPHFLDVYNFTERYAPSGHVGPVTTLLIARIDLKGKILSQEFRIVPMRQALNITSLLPYTDYALCLPVVYQEDRECDLVRTEAELPAAGPAPNVSQVTAGGFAASWTSPGQSDVGGRLDYYHVAVNLTCQYTSKACPCQSQYYNEYVDSDQQSIQFRGNVTFSTLYSVAVQVENHAGRGPWGAPTYVTSPRAHVQLKPDQITVYPNTRSLRVFVAEPCPYTGPVVIMYYLKSSGGRTLQRAHNIFDLGSPNAEDHSIDDVTFDDLEPDVEFSVCVRFQTLDLAEERTCLEECEDQACVKERTFIDVEDPPPILSITDLNGSSFVLEISRPPNPSTTVLHYSVKLGTACSECSTSTFSCGNNTSTVVNTSRQKLHPPLLEKFDGLLPYQTYAATVVAHTPSGESLPASLEVRTAPTWQNTTAGELFLVALPGNDYVLAKFELPCLGPVRMDLEVFFGQRQEWKTAVVSTSLTIEDLSLGSAVAQIDGLQEAKDYSICGRAALASESPPCSEGCEIDLQCLPFKTVCKSVPEAAKLPQAVAYGPGQDDFNPLREVKLKLEAFTFNGNESAIKHYLVDSPTTSATYAFTSRNSSAWYSEDSFLVVGGLDPGRRYEFAVTAVGCGDSARTTDVFSARTLPFEQAKLVVVEIDLASNLMETPMVLRSNESYFKLTESRLNILHADIASYTFGDVIVDAAELFDRETFLPSPTGPCRKTTAEPEEGICYLIMEYDQDLGSLSFHSYPQGHSVSVKVRWPRSALWGVGVGGAVLLSAANASLAWAAFRRRKSRARISSRGREPASTLVEMAQERPVALDGHIYSAPYLLNGHTGVGRTETGTGNPAATGEYYELESLTSGQRRAYHQRREGEDDDDGAEEEEDGTSVLQVDEEEDDDASHELADSGPAEDP